MRHAVLMATLAAIACAIATSRVIGQYAGNTGVGGIGAPGAGGQVNPQVNTALYGGGVPASVRYASVGSTSVAMRSEVRYAAWSSGALPSDIRMGYASLGPLNPAGPLAYIPPAKPSYLPSPSTATPAAAGSSAFSNTAIRYASRAPGSASSTYVAPVSAGARPMGSQSMTGGPINAGPINAGPINTAVGAPAPINPAINRGPINAGAIRYSP